MIELVPTEHDDSDFLALAEQIANGAVIKLSVHEVYLIHIDNWFDHKWWRWWSWQPGELYAPPFNPNRVLSEKRYQWDSTTSTWTASEHSKRIHCKRPGRYAQSKRLLTHWGECAAFIWYSGRTTINTTGSLMFYLTGTEGYSWYASFRKKERWQIADECRITRQQLLIFEEAGKQFV